MGEHVYLCIASLRGDAAFAQMMHKFDCSDELRWNEGARIMRVQTRRDPMCAGDDKSCPEFELHHRKFKETLDRERRSFLRSSFAAAGGVAAMTAGGISL